ncbi:hypothetical protein BDP27DRAFT_1331939 [Rhodocollybia butyracea]|uniref:N-acetyltransferase domain-containing protein n=1 Tax=Rhodocollybia butyracea TaxID=206335 RepID=A0A9P5U4B0_9AGAR|nr:hypothetical protein BDP27DRAFT_1331939 [Rhodocollybia butyracea]
MAEEAVMFLIIETRASLKNDVEGGEFVGTTSIMMTHPKNRDGIFGIMLEPKFWGEDTEKNLGVFNGNERAKRLYQKMGFIEEGRKRKVNWIDGHWEDHISMGILQEEWEETFRASKKDQDK